MKGILMSGSPRLRLFMQHAVQDRRRAKTIQTNTTKQRWEENQVPPGVPICLTQEKSYGHTVRREEKVFDFSHARGKKKNAGVPVYHSTQRKVIRETRISFISLDEQNYKVP